MGREVILLVALGGCFLAFFQNFGRWQGTMDGTLLFNEYRLSFGVS